MEMFSEIGGLVASLKSGLELSNEWIGVIGTLLGTILGWILNSLSKQGKLKIYIYDWKDSFWSTKGDKISDYAFGHQIDNFSEDILLDKIFSSSKEQATHYEYCCSIDLYNSSENTKIMRNIKIVFYQKSGLTKQKLSEDVPEDYETQRGKYPYYFYSEIQPVNVKPKTVKKIRLIKELRHFDFIWNAQQIFLEYNDEKNRRKRVRIKKENYQRYFQNHPTEEK